MSMKMRFPQGKRKAFTISYDDAVVEDIRLIELMQKFGIRGTFNINSGLYAPEDFDYPIETTGRRLTKNRATLLYSSKDIEVAAHTTHHENLTQLPIHESLKEISADKLELEKQFHTPIRGLAYPFGARSENIDSLVRCAGFDYGRTNISSYSFNLPQDWMKWDFTCRHGDPKLMDLANQFLFDESEMPLLFFVFGHSYEFEEQNNWHVIEQLFSFVSSREEVWHATNIEVCEYIKAYRALIIGDEGGCIYNPSALPVYFDLNGEAVCVLPAETKIIHMDERS